MTQVWTRPTSAPYPAVYSRFSGRVPKDGGPPMRFRIQDVTEEMTQQVIDFMAEDFASDEPIFRGLKLKSDKKSMDAMQILWHHAIQARIALVCLLETGDGSVSTDDETPQGKPVIVGANITTLSTKGEVESEAKSSDTMGSFSQCYKLICEKSQIFEKYGVNEIMTAYGLSVARGFRGQNIGSELLRARVPICKAVGLKVTGTLFSAKASQILARRCGFVLLAEISYKDLKEVHNVDCGDTGCESMEYMALEII